MELGEHLYRRYVKFIIDLVIIWKVTHHNHNDLPYSTYMTIRNCIMDTFSEHFIKTIDKPIVRNSMRITLHQQPHMHVPPTREETALEPSVGISSHVVTMANVYLSQDEKSQAMGSCSSSRTTECSQHSNTSIKRKHLVIFKGHETPDSSHSQSAFLSECQFEKYGRATKSTNLHKEYNKLSVFQQIHGISLALKIGEVKGD